MVVCIVVDDVVDFDVVVDCFVVETSTYAQILQINAKRKHTTLYTVVDDDAMVEPRQPALNSSRS